MVISTVDLLICHMIIEGMTESSNNILSGVECDA